MTLTRQSRQLLLRKHKFCFQIVCAGDKYVCCGANKKEQSQWVSALQGLVHMRHPRFAFRPSLAVNMMSQADRYSGLTQGWLEKCSVKSMKNWKRRFFRWDRNTQNMEYYEKESSKRPKGRILLGRDSCVNKLEMIGPYKSGFFGGSDEVKHFRFVIEGTHDTLHVCAGTDTEREEWVHGLLRTIAGFQ